MTSMGRAAPWQGFALGGRAVDLVGVGDAGRGRPGDGSLRFYTMDSSTRQLTNITQAGALRFDVVSYGFCMYRSRISGKLYAFTQDKLDGRVLQVELHDAGGWVGGVVVRSFDVGERTEGCRGGRRRPRPPLHLRRGRGDLAVQSGSGRFDG
jgi:myo-inositol-hexaphosphate 3-phosphohydrolase